ncbi:phage major capsid protein [Actinopolymorpha sp. B17G11]|uniref:phage major capsid protein n=1 Tax=Actinopolymorpha sp. B17G11 TaxID=3160861 RepID=UPI0032E3DAA7
MSDNALVKALTEQLVEQKSAIEGISSEFKTDEKGRFEISKDQHKNYVEAVRRAQEIKGLLDSAKAEGDLGAYLDAPEEGSAAGQHFGQPQDQESKTLGDVFIESEMFQKARSKGFTDRPFIHAGMEGKSIFSMSAGTHTIQAFGSAQDLGITELQRRKMHVRDLFPKSTTKAAVLYGIRETGWVNNAAQVKERYAADGTSPATGGPTDVFGKAPESDLEFAPVLYPVAEIAHILRGHKNLLSDEPRLRTFINTRMVEGVKFAEDRDLLHSVGDGEKITGLFNTPGVQTYTGLATDQYSVQIRRAITRVLLAEYEPTGIVLSPQMWEHVEVEEDDNGAFRVAVAVAIGAEKRVWRLNVVETTAMADDKFLMGAFGMGAQLHDRENVSVTVSTEDSDNFQRGVVTFRADERVALEVPRPESFCIGTWTTPTP